MGSLTARMGTGPASVLVVTSVHGLARSARESLTQRSPVLLFAVGGIKLSKLSVR